MSKTASSKVEICRRKNASREKIFRYFCDESRKNQNVALKRAVASVRCWNINEIIIELDVVFNALRWSTARLDELKIFLFLQLSFFNFFTNFLKKVKEYLSKSCFFFCRNILTFNRTFKFLWRAGGWFSQKISN